MKSVRGRLVSRSAGEIPRTTEAELDRLEAAMNDPVDTSDIPEHIGPFRPIRRDAMGRLPTWPRGPICRAILAELGRRNMTRYELWKRAREHCKTLPESAVYEFLRGQRQIGTTYLEAILAAAGLTVTRARSTSGGSRARRAVARR